MHFRSILAPLLAASTAVAQHVHYEPAQVRKYVNSMINEFSEYTHYPGPSPTWWNRHAHPTHPVKPVQPPPQNVCEYWLEDVKHQGVAAFNQNPGTYTVFRNVKDYGAQGDGVTDDTDAINSAISDGNRCAPGSCASTTTSPAVVYFPPGTYMINSSIVDYYYTMLIGNPNCLPTIRAFSTFAAKPGNIGLIDGDPYGAGGLSYGSTNVFWRQIRNFVLDMTLIPASSSATGIHWPTGQATSIQNVLFEMNSDSGTQHQGIFIESGSGGFMNDLTFNGGLYGLAVGNQQFTMRNLTFNNVVTAINQIWDWGWTYYGITINNCTTGVNMAAGAPDGLSVGSIVFFDSYISDTPVFFRTGYTANSQPPTANSLILENIRLSNVPIAVQGGDNSTVLQGTPTNTLIDGWGEGHSYTPNGPNDFQGPIQPVARPAGLLGANGDYYTRSKPQYEQYGASYFISARDQGATGDGHTDDTAALQKAIYTALSQGKILFVDHGDYLVTKTIYIPGGSRIVGEAYSVILSSGEFFNDLHKPEPVVQIGKPGEVGTVEWSDMIVSTQGQQKGAILFEYNINSSGSKAHYKRGFPNHGHGHGHGNPGHGRGHPGHGHGPPGHGHGHHGPPGYPPGQQKPAPGGLSGPTGVWDVHARIGGFAGSNLQLSQCPTTPNVDITAANLDYDCIAAFLTVHITKFAAGLYLENDWIWTADHDVEDPQLRQITVYTGRGLLDESRTGPVWLVGTAVEHNVLYEYQFVNTRSVFAGQIQTETAYYQPNPPAPLPFPYNAKYHDPQFPQQKTIQADGYTIPSSDGWGLRIVDSDSISIYGAGLYSFFNNYSTSCSNQGNGEVCQSRIFSLEGDSTFVTVYNENTVGTHYMITVDGKDVAYYGDNLDGFVDTIALFRNS